MKNVKFVGSELKDHYTVAEPPVEEQNTPELLKAILQRNPHVFKGPLGEFKYIIVFFIINSSTFSSKTQVKYFIPNRILMTVQPTH